MSKLTRSYLTHMVSGAYAFLSENFGKVHAMVDVTDMEIPFPLLRFVNNNTVRVSIGPNASPNLLIENGVMSAPMSIGGVKFVLSVELNRIMFLSDAGNDCVIPLNWQIIANPSLLDESDTSEYDVDTLPEEESRVLGTEGNVTTVKFGQR